MSSENEFRFSSNMLSEAKIKQYLLYAQYVKTIKKSQEFVSHIMQR